MLQIMTAQTDKKQYPGVSARISEEWEKKFHALLRFIQIDHPHTKASDLVRILIGADNRIEVKREWREYLSGLRDSLPEAKDMARTPRMVKTGSSKDIGRGKVDD